jgi:MFS family permease
MQGNSPRRVLFASLIGTTIEFFDFYIYANAAVLVFPQLFFPASDPATATLQSLATFALAFFARPVGSAVFGHYGDRIGRKATLVAALLTMGLSTVLIGLLPTYASAGLLAPALLALCRFGQGFGLGGEWGGAVLLATENAPAGKHNERVSLPMAEVFRRHGRVLLLGIFAAVSVFVVFYLMTVFALSWGTSKLGFSRQEFLVLLMIGMVFFGMAIPLSALLADRFNPRPVLMAATAGMALFGLLFAPLLAAGSTGSVLLCLVLGLALMGFGYGPLGAALSALFPTPVRYTGASLSFNFAGIVGASLTPYVATWLATGHGVAAVGYYLSAAGIVSLLALVLLSRGAMSAPSAT